MRLLIVVLMSWAESALISLLWPALIIAIIVIVTLRKKKAKSNVQATIQAHGISPVQQQMYNNVSQANRQMSFCPSCGAQLKGESRFCSNCGKAVSSAQQSAPPIQQYKQTASIINAVPDIYIKGKPLSKAQRVLNLASSEQLIDVFSFSNGIVYIQTQGNQSLQAPLNFLSASFQYWPNTKQRTATIEFQGQKINLAEAPTSVSKADYDKVFYVLSQAGTTYGAESISPENMALADQMVSFQRGYSMANAMKRW